jgi:hypothetical protein
MKAHLGILGGLGRLALLTPSDEVADVGSHIWPIKNLPDPAERFCHPQMRSQRQPMEVLQ